MADGRWQRRAAALAAALAAFAVTWLVLTVGNESAPSLSSGDLSRASEGDLAALRADKYLQKVRETGDIGYYAKARDALRGVRGSAAAETSRGTLALAFHDFRGGLRHGLEARRLAPEVARPLSVIADAQVELGRYDDAARTLQRMMDEKPALAAYARVSYFRELHGDMDGAVQAMRLAVSAGGEAKENVVFVQTLVGKLEFDLGHLDAAAHAYRLALARVPGHAGARHGLAQVDAARGDVSAAIAKQRSLVGPHATPEAVLALAEMEVAGGRHAASTRTVARVKEMLRVEAARGVGNSNERALVEADFGDRAAAVELGRRGWAHAPSVTSADALGWAYTRSGHPERGLKYARRALRLGSRDRLFLYHAGIAARDAGRPRLARLWLAAAVDGNPRFSPLHGPHAVRALRQLR